MALLKGCEFAQHGQTGVEIKVYDVTAGIAAPETTSQYIQVPGHLRSKRIWLPFKTSPRPAGGVNKIPYNRQGRPAKYTDPSTWLSYEEALQQARKPGYGGIGIVLSEELGIIGIDFDHCIQDGELNPEIEQWLLDLNTYTEVSFSGDGLHALAFGRIPWNAHHAAKVEMYDRKRYFVVTGRQVTGTPDEIMPAQAGIDAIHGQVFGNQPVETVDTTAHANTPEKGEGGRGAGEGEVGIVEAESAIPDRRVLGMLLHDRVARRYFDGEAGAMNPSEADFALACKLAFYCGGDMDQMRRLFLQSALVRGKTLSPRAIAGDYLGITLWNAARRQRAKGVYWVPAKPKTRRPRGGPDGRPQSVTTTAIITLRAARPELTYQGIADALGIKIETVRKAIHRMGRRESPSSSCRVVDPEPAMAKEAEAILEGEPVQEELMSCPRHHRADYAKPNGWVDIPYKPILPDGVTYEKNYVLPPRRKPPIRSFNIRGQLPVNMRRVAQK
jgi:putative DNA primase/helicase